MSRTSWRSIERQAGKVALVLWNMNIAEPLAPSTIGSSHSLGRWSPSARSLPLTGEDWR